MSALGSGFVSRDDLLDRIRLLTVELESEQRRSERLSAALSEANRLGCSARSQSDRRPARRGPSTSPTSEKFSTRIR